MRWYKVLEAIVILLLVHYGNCTNISCPDSPVQLGATVNVTVDSDVDLRTLETGSISIEFYPGGNTGSSVGDLVSCDWTKGIEHVECTSDKTRYRHSFQERPAKLVLTILNVSRNDVGKYKFQMVSTSDSIDTSKHSCTLNVEGFIVTSSADAVTTTIGVPSPSSQLDGDEIAGIVIGVVLIAPIVITIVLLVRYCKWRRAKKRNGDARKDDNERSQNESLLGPHGKNSHAQDSEEIVASNRSTKTTEEGKDREEKEETMTSKENKSKDATYVDCNTLIEDMHINKKILCAILKTEEKLAVGNTYTKTEKDEEQRVNQILKEIIAEIKNEPLYVLWDLRLSKQPELTATETFVLTCICIDDNEAMDMTKFSRPKALILEQLHVSHKTVDIRSRKECNYTFIVENAK